VIQACRWADCENAFEQAVQEKPKELTTMIELPASPIADPPAEELVHKVLARLGMHFEISIDRSDVLSDSGSDDPDPLHCLISSATTAGIVLSEAEFEDTDQPRAFIREGYALLIVKPDSQFVMIDHLAAGRFQAAIISKHTTERTLGRTELRGLLTANDGTRAFVAKKRFDLDSISAAPYHDDLHHHAEALTPLRRFIGLLRLEVSDIGTVVLFAFVGGILTLATPLAVESLVNVVSWGTYVQPLIVLGVILLMCLGIAGVLRVLQKWTVELIQRRLFVRIVSDLAHRFPRANQEALGGEYPRELANRVFDIMTIQKATSVLLLDGLSIVLTTVLGMVLLAFYHPFLLGFDIVLLISMISITWLLGRGGIRTAIDESITKYRVVHWLQDVIASPAVFKTGGGEALAIQRANQLTADYIAARKRQFGVVIRQSAFAICLQVIASTALLALGGWLVIDGQLTLGQLVASELVVTIVVGAFAKAGKSLEKYYDLMAGIDKVGHLIDIPAESYPEVGAIPTSPVPVRWNDLTFRRIASQSQIPAAVIDAGARVAIVGDDVDGKSDFSKTLAGLRRPTDGVVQVGELDSQEAAIGCHGQIVGYAGNKEVFHGTLRENVDLGRTGLGAARVREVLSDVGLSEVILRLPKGLQTELQTDGHPLTRSQIAKLVIARAIAAKPKLVVIDGLLDEMPASVREKVWSTLTSDRAPWTVIVVTNRIDIAELCESQIVIRETA
jgi:putative ABC transport system ATP-binding protein